MIEPLKTFSPNTKGRDFVIGDLHGAFSVFENLLKNLEFDRENDRVFSVGDLVDRGPDSLKCLGLLREPWFHAVLSNHEQMMLHAFTYGPTGTLWSMNGGAWGSKTLEAAMVLQKGTEASISPEDEELFNLLALVEELPFLITIEMKDGKKYHVIHAEIPPHQGVTDATLADPDSVRRLATQPTRDGVDFFLWGRELFYPVALQDLSNKQKLERIFKHNKANDQLSHVISGHTIVQRPVTVAGQTNIDTAAFASYRGDRKWCALTCVDLAAWKFFQATETTFCEVEPVVINT